MPMWWLTAVVEAEATESVRRHHRLYLVLEKQDPDDDWSNEIDVHLVLDRLMSMHIG